MHRAAALVSWIKLTITCTDLAGSDEATAAVELGRDTTLEKSQESASQESKTPSTFWRNLALLVPLTILTTHASGAHFHTSALERINAVTSRIQVLVPQMQSRRRPISSSAYWFDHPEVKAAASFVDKYGTNKTILMAIDYGGMQIYCCLERSPC